MSRRLPGSQVRAYRTARVVFFLVLHPEHGRGIAAVDRQLGERWKNEITRVLPMEERAAGDP